MNVIDWTDSAGANSYYWERWPGAFPSFYFGWDSLGTLPWGNPLTSHWDDDWSFGSMTPIDTWTYTYRINAKDSNNIWREANFGFNKGMIDVVTNDCQKPNVWLCGNQSGTCDASGNRLVFVDPGTTYNLTWNSRHSSPNRCIASTSSGVSTSFTGIRGVRLNAPGELVTAPNTPNTTYTHYLRCYNDDVGPGGNPDNGLGDPDATVTVRTNVFATPPPPCTAGQACISCSGSPSNPTPGSTVTWTSTLSGVAAGQTGVTYNWSNIPTQSGTDLTSVNWTVPSNASGTYTQNVTGTKTISGTTYTASASCSVNVYTSPLTVSCSASTTSNPLEARWTASSAGGNGNPITYNWFGTTPLQGRTGNPVTVTYSSAGSKTGYVEAIQTGSTTTTSSNCSVTFPPSTPPPVIITAGFNSTCLDTDNTVNGSNVDIDWSPSSGVIYVDISTSPTFTGTYYHKQVPSGSTTTNGTGFNEANNPLITPLIYQPNTTYYVRLYNGITNIPTSAFPFFTTPADCATPFISLSTLITGCYTDTTWPGTINFNINDPSSIINSGKVDVTVSPPSTASPYPATLISSSGADYLYRANIPTSAFINSPLIQIYNLTINARNNASVVKGTLTSGNFEFNHLTCTKPFFSTSGGDVHSNESISQP